MTYQSPDCTNQRITSITVNGKAAYELKGRFLNDLRKNAFSGTNGEDARKVDNQEVVTNEGYSNLEKANNDDEHKIAKIFRIETNLLDYETPLCTKLNEFKYLLKVDTELFTHDNGKAKWPTCNSNEDGFCNGGELPGMVWVGYMTYFQEYEWYDDLTDNNLKEEALKRKSIFEKSWGDATQRMVEHATTVIFRKRRNNTKRDNEEEYVAVKEYEYDDFTRTNEDACHAYQEIFHNMDERWLVTRA
ncbi:hypothetical protein Tco_0820779 [Tanacetum coccineum]|uniref:Uncharacterized protein n=1 Tax=Tanacetum coccineum TaxID=301880 RepID=A0ABQ5AAD9_9ASTR